MARWMVPVVILVCLAAAGRAEPPPAVADDFALWRAWTRTVALAGTPAGMTVYRLVLKDGRTFANARRTGGGDAPDAADAVYSVALEFGSFTVTAAEIAEVHEQVPPGRELPYSGFTAGSHRRDATQQPHKAPGGDNRPGAFF
ncbi:MAG: hypothetical protein ABIF71_03595 [Planctomycetota bacterium]